MHDAPTSFRKTIAAAAVAGLVAIAIAHASQATLSAVLPTSFVTLLIALGWIVGMLLLVVALSGLLVSFRYSSRQRGEEDLFFALNRSRSEAALLDRSSRSARVGFPRLRRWLGAPAYIVNDVVRIRSLAEILATLDANGCLDGLPFMPEMAKYCGTTGTVFRCVDKIYDYGGKKDMRRFKDAVLISGLRCDGGAHDGCQARCYMLWKTAWIERSATPAMPRQESLDRSDKNVVSGGSIGPTFVRDDGTTDGRYVCQYTELVRSSTKMSPSDLRQDLRPLIAGNVTVMAFCVAMLTRLFNAVQRLRGGIVFPSVQQCPGTPSGQPDLDLQPGEFVRVCDPETIFATLNKSGKNRGLWFDRGMLSYCKREYRVLVRVDKLIDDATGRMLRMKNPCIVLEGVDAAGETVRFLAQHDYPFWREAWLERVDRHAQADRSAQA